MSNAGKFGPEKLRQRTLFAPWYICLFKNPCILFELKKARNRCKFNYVVSSAHGETVFAVVSFMVLHSQ